MAQKQELVDGAFERMPLALESARAAARGVLTAWAEEAARVLAQLWPVRIRKARMLRA